MAPADIVYLGTHLLIEQLTLTLHPPVNDMPGKFQHLLWKSSRSQNALQYEQHPDWALQTINASTIFIQHFYSFYKQFAKEHVKEMLVIHSSLFSRVFGMEQNPDHA